MSVEKNIYGTCAAAGLRANLHAPEDSGTEKSLVDVQRGSVENFGL
jgi:hypothetical protein